MYVLDGSFISELVGPYHCGGGLPSHCLKLGSAVFHLLSTARATCGSRLQMLRAYAFGSAWSQPPCLFKATIEVCSVSHFAPTAAVSL